MFRAILKTPSSRAAGPARPVAALALALALPLAWPMAHAFGAGGQGGERFKQLDTNGDGSLGREELQSAPVLLSKFDEIDADKSGQLSKRELAQYMRAHKGEVLSKLDGDGDGYLSREEAAKLPRLAALFEQLDTDKDGKLNPQELSAMKKP